MKFLKKLFEKKDEGINSALYEAESTITELTKSKNSAKSELESLKKSNESIVTGLKVEIEKERAALMVAKDKLNKLRSENKRLRERVKEANESENKIVEKISQINEQLLIQSEELDKRTNEGIRLKSQLTSKERKIENLELKLDESNRKNDEIDERLKEALITIRSISSSQLKYEAEIKESQKALEKANEDISYFKKFSEAIDNSKTSQLQGELTASMSKVENLEARLLEAMSEINELKSRINDGEYKPSIWSGEDVDADGPAEEFIQEDLDSESAPVEEIENPGLKEGENKITASDINELPEAVQKHFKDESSAWLDDSHPDEDDSVTQLEEVIGQLEISKDELREFDFIEEDYSFEGYIQNTYLGLDDEEDVEAILAEAGFISEDYDTTTDYKTDDLKISRNERALQLSLGIVDEFNLKPESVKVLHPIFISKGWSAAKSSIVRLLSRGATIEEIDRSYEIRKFWTENHELSTFYRSSGEPVSRNVSMPWNLALDFLRSFKGLPDISEMEEYLLESLQYWMSKPHLHINYPSYLIYLKAIIESSRDDEILPPPYTSGRLQ